MKNNFQKLIVCSLALVLLCAGVSFASSTVVTWDYSSHGSFSVEIPAGGNLWFSVRVISNNPFEFNSSIGGYRMFGGSNTSLTCTSDTFVTVDRSQWYFSSPGPSGYFTNITNSSYSLQVLSSGALFREDSVVEITYSLDGSVVSTGKTFDFSLKPGYALVIDGECEVSERTYNLSGSSSLNIFQNKNGSVQWFGASGNIRDGFSPDQSNPLYITWEALNANSAGNASSYRFYANDVISVSSGASFVITNPLNYGTIYVSTGARAVIENVNMTGSIYIQYSGERPSIRYVALDSHMQGDGLLTFYNTFAPSVLNENVSFSDGSGDSVVINPSNAPIGGGNAGSPSIDEDNSFLAVIQRLLNQIKGLFSSAVEGITGLVNEGSSFMRSIAQIFTWLPEPLLALLISGFTVLLVVGVLKVLWK